MPAGRVHLIFREAMMEQPTEGLMFEELEKWRRIISDGDWAVKEYWVAFNESEGYLEPATPERIGHFMAYLVRLIDGETNPAP